MAIDRNGRFWRGEDASDVAEYLRELTPGGYPVTHAVKAVCDCGATEFSLRADSEEGLAQTECTACGRTEFVSDSGEHWSEGEPTMLACTCQSSSFQVCVGLSVREGSWVRWVSVGVRCARCGLLGCPADWKSHEPFQAA